MINYYPRYLNNPESPTYADYCRVRLMLHHPFVDYADLLNVDGQVYGSSISLHSRFSEGDVLNFLIFGGYRDLV